MSGPVAAATKEVSVTASARHSMTQTVTTKKQRNSNNNEMLYDAIHDGISSSSGQPLNASSTLEYFEPMLAHNFANVRVLGNENNQNEPIISSITQRTSTIGNQASQRIIPPSASYHQSNTTLRNAENATTTIQSPTYIQRSIENWSTQRSNASAANVEASSSSSSLLSSSHIGSTSTMPFKSSSLNRVVASPVTLPSIVQERATTIGGGQSSVKVEKNGGHMAGGKVVGQKAPSAPARESLQRKEVAKGGVEDAAICSHHHHHPDEHMMINQTLPQAPIFALPELHSGNQVSFHHDTQHSSYIPLGGIPQRHVSSHPYNSPNDSSIPIANLHNVQMFSNISSPADTAEVEARDVAKKIMSMVVVPESSTGDAIRSGTNINNDNNVSTSSQTHNDILQRKAEGHSEGMSNVPSIPSKMGSGSPLPAKIRSFMEPRFKKDFSHVRIYTGDQAAQVSEQLNAQAFTVGANIFFGKERYQPDSPSGQELIAHELTHTIQQGATIRRSISSQDVSVTHHSPVQIQRLGISDALNEFANKAYLIPGFRMFTIILGVNPINMTPVDRSPVNILRALIEFIPGGALIAQALDNHRILEKVANWVEQQIRTLGVTGSSIKQALDTFLRSLNWLDIFSLGDLWERAKRIFTEPINRIINFAKGLGTGIIQYIKDAILMPLAKLAEGTRGWDLLVAVLGKNPITGEAVPRTPETLIGGFMKLIGQEDVWENIKKANAIGRAWTWFQDALKGVMGFVQQIPTLAMNAFKSLELADIIVVPRAFAKVAAVFGDFIGNFISWAGNAVWNLLEIVFDVVSPGALRYIKRTGEALKGILKSPMVFVGNLVKAAKQGFQNFAANFGTHLKAGLIDWLTGSLPGIYIPKAFELEEIVKFVFSVLGLSWQNVRQKLVKAVGETTVKAMETGFDIVVTLVKSGPAAAWDKIKEQLSNLKDTVIGGITDFVVDTVVQKAVPKLLAMFVPGAGFISAILSIYDTIMVFVEKLSKIGQVVKAFVDSIVAIASGSISGAANRVESTLAGILSLAINFLAGFAGLGKVADKVMGVIGKVRAPIDKALDALINWIVTMARKLGRFVAQAGVPQDPNERLRLGIQAAVGAANRFAGREVGMAVLTPLLDVIKVRYAFQTLELISQGQNWAIRGQINPVAIAGTRVIKPKVRKEGERVETGESITIVFPAKIIYFRFKRFTDERDVNINEMTEALQHHQAALNNLTVYEWLRNIESFEGRKKDIENARRRHRRRLVREFMSNLESQYKEKNISISSKELLKRVVKMRTMALDASHAADAVAGGDIEEFHSLERGAVNQYFGSVWDQHKEDLRSYAADEIKKQFVTEDQQKNVRMNFRLRIEFSN